MLEETGEVAVMVPRKLHARTLRFLAEQMEPSAPAEPEEEKPVLTGELVRRMYGESEPTHRRLFEVLADSARGKWIDYGEVSKLMGYDTRRSLPGTLGALARRSNHRYGGLWPFRVRQRGDEWEAYMEPWVAAVIEDERKTGHMR